MYKKAEVLSMFRQIVNMSTEDYIHFCIMLRGHCPPDLQVKAELVLHATMIIRKKVRKG